MNVQTVSDYIWEALALRGLKHAFILPGGGCMYLVDALARNSKVEAIPLLHEQSVGIAAESYAQYKNSIGAALVTTGPGATNALTACAAAWTDSTPVIFISGQVKNEHSRNGTNLRQKGFQEIPIIEMVKPITKEARIVRTPQEAVNAITELVDVATFGRPGPVWLDIPLDIQNSKFQVKSMEDFGINMIAPKSPERFSLSDIAEEWGQAKRPILLAGNGVRHSEAIELMKQLAIATKTPIMLTWKALDFLDDEFELNAGRPGTTAQPWANISIQNSDFLLILGARMDMGQVAYRAETLARGAKVTMVDIDVDELRKFSHLNWRLVEEDVKNFIAQLLDYGISKKCDTSDWILEIRQLKQEFPLVGLEDWNISHGVSNYLFLDELAKEMNSTDLLVPGSSGACSEVTMQAFKVKDGQRILNSEALGPMGFGIPAAIGAHIGSGGRRTICIDGDGGFMMNIQDLATVAGRNLNIKFFVLNNNGYESIRTTQKNIFAGRYIGVDSQSGIFIPSICGLADGFGIPYFKISHNSEIEDSLKHILNAPGPSVTEVIIPEDSEIKYRVKSFIDGNGIIQSYPMEDMSPLVSLEKLAELLRIDLLPESISRERNNSTN